MNIPSRLFPKNIWGWVVLSLIPLVTIVLSGLLGYQIAAGALRSLVHSNNVTAATITAQFIGSELQRGLDLEQSTISRASFQKAIRRHNPSEIQQQLRYMLENDPDLDQAYVINAQGSLLSEFPASLPPEKNFADREWYQGVLRSGHPFVSGIYRSSSPAHPFVLALASPIFDDHQKLFRILVFQYQQSTLMHWLKGLSVGKSGHLFIVDHNQAIAAHPEDSNIGKSIAGTPPANRASSASDYFDPLLKQKVTAVSVPVRVAQDSWLVVSAQPVSEAYEPLHRIALQITLAAITLGLSTLVLFWILSGIYRRLQTLNDELATSNAQLAKSREELEDKVKNRTDELVQANQVLKDSRSEVERLYREAQNANQIKDEFLLTLSHELRTPLNAIVGWIDLLKAQPNDPEVLRQGLEVLERSAKAQTNLIGDLLDVSRIISGKLQLDIQPVDYSAIIQSVIESLALAIRAKKIKLQLTIDSSSTLISGDSARIQQIVWNLLSNAIKFTQPGGNIDISLHPDGPNVQLVVQDTGIGIDPKMLPHIFERFYQADSSVSRPYGGLGLGLAIARHLVELHGGNIRVVSEGKGHGATFIVTLPLVPPALPELGVPRLEIKHPSEIVPMAAKNLKGRKILLVDDDPDALMIQSKFLQIAGADVQTANSAPAAIEKLHHLTPDLIISDIGMPGEDGYQFIKKVRASDEPELRNIPAIALTAYVGEEEKNRALTSGYQAHVSKPVTSNTLQSAISRVLH